MWLRCCDDRMMRNIWWVTNMHIYAEGYKEDMISLQSALILINSTEEALPSLFIVHLGPWKRKC